MTPIHVPQDLHHLVPSIGRDIAESIGWEKASIMFAVYGGREVSVPMGKTPLGIRAIEELCGVIGSEAAGILVERFGGARISVPTCRAVRRVVRDRQLRAEFDSLTLRMSALRAVDQIADIYQITSRQVWSILKRIE